MSRLIYADAVLYALVEEGHDNATKYGFRLGDTIKFTPTQVDEIVSRMPTIEERKKGRWTNAYDGYYDHVKCTGCFKTYDWTSQAQYYNYCPNCGADMRGEQDE